MTDQTNQIAGSRIDAIEADDTTSVGRSRRLRVARDDRETVLGAKSVSVGRKLTLQVGEELEILVGQSRLLLKKDGTILISGRDLSVDGAGKVTIKASSDVTLKGKKILQN
jgi:type VI secretion system secreted protein VgrG